MLTIIGSIFISLGAMAFVISAIGLLRMPDVYTRMHVGAKTTTMGTMLVIIGAICLEPSWAFKLILLGAFVFLTNPISSSVIARASHKIDIPYFNPKKIDELKDFQEEHR